MGDLNGLASVDLIHLKMLASVDLKNCDNIGLIRFIMIKQVSKVTKVMYLPSTTAGITLTDSDACLVTLTS